MSHSSIRTSPLNLLARNDKWYLGCGTRLLFAPSFPQWLRYPGFWDKAHYFNLEIEPLFTWTLLDQEGNPIPLEWIDAEWKPDALRSRFAVRSILTTSLSDITENKYCTSSDTLASTISLTNRGRKPLALNLVAWSIQPVHASEASVRVRHAERNGDAMHFIRHTRMGNGTGIPIFCALGINRRVVSSSIVRSEGTIMQPHWRYTPFGDAFRAGRLPDDGAPAGPDDDGLLYIALHTAIALSPGTEERVIISFSVSSDPTLIPTRKGAARGHAVPAPPSHHSPLHPVSVSSLARSLRDSTAGWRRYFRSMPYFSCSDEHLSSYYWYRWYGLRLNTIAPVEGRNGHPFVCEGIGYFRAPISFSAPCHVLENRWLHDPSLARGSMDIFLDNQRRDGLFPGYIDPWYIRPEMFYHANWGRAIRALHTVHPDRAFLRRAYDGLTKYAAGIDRERDPERSGLYDIHNHYETGQEYMHRYVAVDRQADRDNWGRIFRLKGVDVTVYMYELKNALAAAAEELGMPHGAARRWRDGAETIRDAVRAKMWDDETGMFFDVDPSTMRRTRVKAAVCFYPYMTDIVTSDHLRGFKRHLFNPDEFWTPYPAPSSSVDDPFFSPDARWKGKRMLCPWNGRVWPMTNSHIAEALAASAIRFDDEELRHRAAEFIMRFIRMMFHEGNPRRPNCYEHYNPVTGNPSVYRGIDDYQHSWVADLIVSYVAGVRVAPSGIVIDPFPFEIDRMLLDNVLVRGRHLRIEKKGSRWSVHLDRKRVGSMKEGQRMEIGW